MWKKLAWVYVAIYVAVILFISIRPIFISDDFNGGSIIGILVTLIPAGVIALEISLKKFSKVLSILLGLVALCVTLVFFLGSIKFNTMSLETVAKGVLFGVAILLLLFLMVRRMRKK